MPSNNYSRGYRSGKSAHDNTEFLEPFNALVAIFAGGAIFELKAGTSYYNFVDRFDFQTNTWTLNWGAMTINREEVSVMVEKKRGGWVFCACGFNSTGTLSAIDGTKLATGGTFTSFGNLSQNNRGGNGWSNSTYGQTTGDANTAMRWLFRTTAQYSTNYSYANTATYRGLHATEKCAYSLGGVNAGDYRNYVERQTLYNDANYTNFGVLYLDQSFYGAVAGNEQIIVAAGGVVDVGGVATNVCQYILTSHNTTSANYNTLPSTHPTAGAASNQHNMIVGWHQTDTNTYRFNLYSRSTAITTYNVPTRGYFNTYAASGR